MEELRHLLENINHDIALLNSDCSYQVDKYGELLKPWRIKPLTNIKEPTQEPNTSQLDPKPADEYIEELAKVDDLLKKARLVREQKHPEESSKKVKKQSRSDQCRDCLKGRCIKHRASKPQTGNDKVVAKSAVSKPRMPQSKSMYKPRVASSVKARPSSSNTGSNPAHSKATACLPANTSPACNVESPSTSQRIVAEPHTVQLEDILKERTLPSKYAKLQKMHSKLRAHDACKSVLTNVPTQAEMSFIAKLTKVETDRDKPLQTTLTAEAANRNLHLCIRRCQNLISVISYKTQRTEDRKQTSIALWREKLMYTKANNLILEIDEFYSWITNSVIINLTSSSSNATIPAFSLQCNDPDFDCFPFKSLTFSKLTKPVIHSQSVYELMCLKMIVYLRKRIEKIYLDLLHTNDDLDISKEFISCVTTAYGLLVNKNRCSIHPAIVCDE